MLRALALAVLVAVGAILTATPQEVEAKDKPNIVFIYTDDMRYDEMARIKRFRDLAAQGVSFESAYVTNPICCPSRATALTGRYSNNHGVENNLRGTSPGGFPAWRAEGLESRNLGSWLQRSNYRTALFGKYLNGYSAKNPPRGFDYYFRTTHPSQDVEIGKKAATWVGKNKSRPMFLALWVKSPHSPFEPHPIFKDRHKNAGLPQGEAFPEGDISDKAEWVSKRVAPKKGEMLVRQRQRLRMLESVSNALARVQTTLKSHNELSNTYFVFVSDNGYLLGEHNLTGKVLPYEESIRVPFVVTGPGIPKGIKRTELVSNNDISPTILSLAKAKWPTAPIDGRSLVPILGRGAAPEDWRTAVMSENPGYNHIPGFHVLRTKDHAYVEWATGERELYDMREDPYQLDGTVNDEALADTLSTRLDALKDCTADGCREAEKGE